MKIQVVMLKQDDPKKCTAAKLVKFGLAKSVHTTDAKTLVLDPFAKNSLIPNDKNLIKSITGIDCSWNLADRTFTRSFLGLHRKLPPLFAGNSVNFSKLNKLTTVEAISAALFILSYDELGKSLLDKFKWGHTFYDLNKNLLEDYCKISSEDEIFTILKEYNIITE